MAAAAAGPISVSATLNFLSPLLKEKPFNYVVPVPDKPTSNYIAEPHVVDITNLRSLSAEDLAAYRTETSGFQIYKHESVEKEFIDEEKIKDVYYKEIEELLKSVTGAKRVFVFDHTIRRPSKNPELPKSRGPIFQTHVDQTLEAGAERVFLHMGEDAKRLSNSRVQIINVWRPIKKVESTPLAYADFRSVDLEKDLQPSDLIYPNRVGETFSVRYNPNQRWYYYSQQEPNEVVLLKCYESEGLDGRARLTPHTAFNDPSSPSDAPGRESIEVRALVFYDE